MSFPALILKGNKLDFQALPGEIRHNSTGRLNQCLQAVMSPVNLPAVFARSLLHLFLFSGVLMLGEVALAQGLPGSGQSDLTEVPIELAQPESKEAVRALVSTLSDDAVRALLIERLDAVAEAKESEAQADAGIVSVARQSFANVFAHAKRATAALDQAPAIVSKFFHGIRSSAPRTFVASVFIILAAVLVGVIAERLVAKTFKQSKQRLIDKTSNTLWGILKIIYTRLTYDVLGVLAFGLASYVVISQYFQAGSIAHQAAYVVTGTLTAGWLAYVVCRFFFSPRRPDLRICNTSDERAMQITVSFSLLAGYVVFMHNLFYLFMLVGDTYYGGPEYMVTLGFWMNMSQYLLAAGVILLNREALTEILFENKKRVSMAIGVDAPEDLSWFAIHWPKIAVSLIFAKYFMVEMILSTGTVGVYSIGAVYITFIVIFLWPGVDANVSLFVARGIPASEDETESAAKARRTMQQGLLRVGRILVVGVVLYSLASLWGLNLMGLAHSGLGTQAAGTLIEFLFILLIAYISWELVSALIGHWIAVEGGLSEDGGEDAGGEIGGAGLSRIATLLPIIRKTSLFLIVVVSFIMVLDLWGVNVAPILAGAGVVGLAIGFGAQTLVKDIVSGLFFLADDAFRVGEYIDVGGTMGSVEKISLRSLRLRHHKGLVHTIPYGEIPKLTNFSRDWVIVKLRFRVPFDTDIHKVKKIFKVIGADLLADPILGDDFLQPFKSQGVAEVDDNGMVVRGKFMAKPGKQFMIRKEVYVRVQKAFEEAGIPFARKQVMVHIPGLEKGDELNKDQIKTVGAAAADAVDDEPEPVK